MKRQTSFAEKCYAALRKVPAGRVTTYAEIARAIGSHGYRAVGMAMNHNPYAPAVPCHRVVMSSGALGGFAGGIEKKIALLRKEGVKVEKGKVLDFEKRFFSL